VIDTDEILAHLPQYLTTGSHEELLKQLRAFPDQGSMYTSALRNDPGIFQGDAFTDFLFVQIPSMASRPGRAMIISNTCDIFKDNRRIAEARLVYAPIISLAKWEQVLQHHGEPAERIAAHIASIRVQKVGPLFFLPAGQPLSEDSVALLDRLQNVPLGYLPEQDVVARRIFTLSNFGFWLFVFKLSIHFCRVRERVDRNAGLDVPA